ncbi:Protein BCAP [Varanus komodoensis]|nr:Protein BCAP [Varanus komodoensis]
MEGNGDVRLMPNLTYGEAEKRCSVIQSCDTSFKKDGLGTETSSQLGNYLSSRNEDANSSKNHEYKADHMVLLFSFFSQTLRAGILWMGWAVEEEQGWKQHSIFYKLPESIEVESLKESWSSYSRLVNEHRTRMKELLPCLKGKSQQTSLEESLSEGETKWLWEDAINSRVTFQEILHETEMTINSAEMFLPSFKETLIRISKACYISASDMIKISVQEDLLVKELQALKTMKGLLQLLLRSSKDKEIIGEQIEDLIQKLTLSETETISLKNEVIEKERSIVELLTQLQQEKANVLKASRHSESVQSVQTHLQFQIEKKEAENNQLRTKIQTIEKSITEWKLQVGEHNQKILAEKERREERRNALRRAARVQKQRAEQLEVVVKSLLSQVKEKEIQLSEVLSASNVWKSHHETVVDEKIRLEVQVETLKKQIGDCMMELSRIQDVGRKSKSEIIGKLNSVMSENEKISLENAKLKASLSALEDNIISAETELEDLHEEAKQQEKLVEQYKIEVEKLETEAEELKAMYEKVIWESRKMTEDKEVEMDAVSACGPQRLPLLYTMLET